MARWTTLRKTFATLPDPSRIYPATGTETALARIWESLEDGEGLVVLTGSPGTGKTLLAYRLLVQLGNERRSILLTNSHFPDRASLLQACLFDLGLPHEGKTEQELRLTLTGHLLDSVADTGSVVLVIDEAQHLSADLLEELRLLGNLEAYGQTALQVVLIGQPELRDRLDQPELRSLAQRITTWSELTPLDLAEAIDYVLHLLRTASPRALEAVPEEVHEIVAGASAGVPRRINQILREALRVADECDSEVVDVEMVAEALSRLGLSGSLEPEIRFDPEPDEGPLAA